MSIYSVYQDGADWIKPSVKKILSMKVDEVLSIMHGLIDIMSIVDRSQRDPSVEKWIRAVHDHIVSSRMMFDGIWNSMKLVSRSDGVDRDRYRVDVDMYDKLYDVYLILHPHLTGYSYQKDYEARIARNMYDHRHTDLHVNNNKDNNRDNHRDNNRDNNRDNHRDNDVYRQPLKRNMEPISKRNVSIYDISMDVGGYTQSNNNDIYVHHTTTINDGDSKSKNTGRIDTKNITNNTMQSKPDINDKSNESKNYKEKSINKNNDKSIDNDKSKMNDNKIINNNDKSIINNDNKTNIKNDPIISDNKGIEKEKVNAIKTTTEVKKDEKKIQDPVTIMKSFINGMDMKDDINNSDISKKEDQTDDEHTKKYVDRKRSERVSKTVEDPSLVIKSDIHYFEGYRSFKIETGDMDACKICVIDNNTNMFDIYLGGPLGLSYLIFDGSTGLGKIRFTQRNDKKITQMKIINKQLAYQSYYLNNINIINHTFNEIKFIETESEDTDSKRGITCIGKPEFKSFTHSHDEDFMLVRAGTKNLYILDNKHLKVDEMVPDFWVYKKRNTVPICGVSTRDSNIIVGVSITDEKEYIVIYYNNRMSMNRSKKVGMKSILPECMYVYNI